MNLVQHYVRTIIKKSYFNVSQIITQNRHLSLLKVVGNVKHTIFLEIINGVLDFDQYVQNQCIHWVLKMKVECRCNIVFCENLVLIMSHDPYFTSFLFSGFHAAVGKPVFHEINMILVLFCSPSLLF